MYIKNIATGRFSRVHKSIKSQFNSDISGTKVIWAQDTATSSVIYVKDLLTGKIRIVS